MCSRSRTPGDDDWRSRRVSLNCESASTKISSGVRLKGTYGGSTLVLSSCLEEGGRPKADCWLCWPQSPWKSENERETLPTTIPLPLISISHSLFPSPTPCRTLPTSSATRVRTCSCSRGVQRSSRRARFSSRRRQTSPQEGQASPCLGLRSGSGEFLRSASLFSRLDWAEACV